MCVFGSFCASGAVSSFSPPAQCGVGGFCASSWGACGFPRRVLPLVTLRGSATFLAPVNWPTPAVETCCWVGGVFGAPLGFLPCAVLFLGGLRFA